tara:strand:+ start:16237 stop:16668 length:432 start_codon:yes stop_codon:yes gene_type:complete
MKFVAFAAFLLTFSQPASADPLDWLVGCWESKDGTSKEVWVKEADGGLSGFSVTLQDNDMVFYEVLRIATASDGTLTYTAHPSGQSSATFRSKSAAGFAVTFANPSHDYPQEIAYKRDGDKLFATISAMHGKNPRSFNKQVCD